MVCREGVEPSTIRLKVECSTTELPAQTETANAIGVAAEHSQTACAVNRNCASCLPQLGRGMPVKGIGAQEIATDSNRVQSARASEISETGPTTMRLSSLFN